jgi:hypothetical protein
LINYFFALISRIINSRKSLIFFNYIYIYIYIYIKLKPKSLHIQNLSMSGPWPKKVQNSLSSLSSFLSILYIKKLKNALKRPIIRSHNFNVNFLPFTRFSIFAYNMFEIKYYNVLKNISDINS